MFRLQCRCIEADLLDATRNGDLADGGRILQGDRVSSDRAAPGLLALAQHPGDNVVSRRVGLDSAAIPASDVAASLRKAAHAQVRGVPWGTPVMRALRDLDDWTQAELVRKKTEACVVGIVLGRR